MKKQIIKLKLLLLVLILLFSLTACGGEDKNKENGKINAENLLNKKDRTWQEENGLFEVREENGQFYISYDLDKWEEIHNFTAYLDEYYIDAQPGRPDSLVTLLEDKVRDITIGLAENYSQSFDEDKEFPVVFFLLENGRVQWLKAMPETIGRDESLKDYEKMPIHEDYVFEPIPWMKDIVSLAPERVTEGFGGQSIFARDAQGLSYNLSLPMEFYPLLGGKWQAEILDSASEYGMVFLEFLDEDRVSLLKLNDDAGRENLELTGSYQMYLDDNSGKGYRAPSIRLDFPGLSGIYMLGHENFFDPFFIFLSDGTPLETGIEEYFFYYSFDEDYN